MLEAKANTQSLILLFSPSVPGGRWTCNLQWLYKASLDKMETLRENAYAKCDPSSISEPIFQLWEEQVSALWGSDIQPALLVRVTVHLASRSPLEWLGVAGSTPRRCLRCPLHCSHHGSLRMPFPQLLHLRRQRARY